MLTCPSSQPDFSQGCAGKRIDHSLFAIHPRRLTMRESTSAMASSSKVRTGQATYYLPRSARSWGTTP
jgi:hypothetical protein